jgi:hypothetical protein
MALAQMAPAQMSDDEMSDGPKNDLWTIVNSISEKTPSFLPETVVNPLYQPWLINTALSNNLDTIIFAEMMNGMWNLDHYMQYTFLYHAIPKRQRRAPWSKRDKSLDDKIALVKEYYGYSTLKAREVIPLIDQLDLWDSIQGTLYKGGKTKQRRGKKKLQIDDV